MTRGVPEEVRRWVQQQESGPNREHIGEIKRIVKKTPPEVVDAVLSTAKGSYQVETSPRPREIYEFAVNRFLLLLCAKAGTRVSRDEQKTATERRENILYHLREVRKRVDADATTKHMLFYGNLFDNAWDRAFCSQDSQHTQQEMDLTTLLEHVETMISDYGRYPPHRQQNASPHAQGNDGDNAQANLLFGELVDWFRYYGSEHNEAGVCLFNGDPQYRLARLAVEAALDTSLDERSLAKQYRRSTKRHSNLEN